MNQRWIVLLVFVVAMELLTGCVSRNNSQELLSVTELVGRMKQQIGSFSEMKQGDAEKLRKLYHIEASDVAEFALYTALSNVKADELAIIKLKDARDIEAIMDQVRQRVATQSVKFKDYRPQEYYLIEKHVLLSKGPVIFFAISKDADRMKHAFDDALK
ncbi:hypothetical protein PAESOLCIP111_02963 [Paenibacillus solanacearum]|uniref:DUF4358 domain-containing protein n=1 Tax=Paenibacillus solanacearum TaxID=2048548 RepID=A0A916K1N5_9BACL|nr:hypothetical protein PAESOLCIP111_02963 [Paenibacillus solanacearum]